MRGGGLFCQMVCEKTPTVKNHSGVTSFQILLSLPKPLTLKCYCCIAFLLLSVTHVEDLIIYYFKLIFSSVVYLHDTF